MYWRLGPLSSMCLPKDSVGRLNWDVLWIGLLELSSEMEHNASIPLQHLVLSFVSPCLVYKVVQGARIGHSCWSFLSPSLFWVRLPSLAQLVFKFSILLPYAPACWDHRHVGPESTESLIQLIISNSFLPKTTDRNVKHYIVWEWQSKIWVVFEDKLEK